MATSDQQEIQVRQVHQVNQVYVQHIAQPTVEYSLLMEKALELNQERNDGFFKYISYRVTFLVNVLFFLKLLFSVILPFLFIVLQFIDAQYSSSCFYFTTIDL